MGSPWIARRGLPNENNMQLLHPAAKNLVKQFELTQDIAGCLMNHQLLTTPLKVGFRASVHFQDARQVREGYYVQAGTSCTNFFRLKSSYRTTRCLIKTKKPSTNYFPILHK